MVQLKKGANNVQLSLTSSFSPIIEFEVPYTGTIHLCKKQNKGTEKKEVTINACNDEVLDLSTYREYFTEYRDEFIELVITVSAKATLEYEPFTDAPVESTAGKTLEFTVKEDPNYNPPEPSAQKCPICQTEVPMSELMAHIQSKHM